MIEFTWISMATNRQRTVVRVELRPIADGGTELSLTHQQLPTEAAAQAVVPSGARARPGRGLWA